MKVKVYNGFIVDGTGQEGFYGELLIDNKKITHVGVAVEETYDLAIDAKGHVIAPGFIDTHSHSDLALLTGSLVKPKIFQGITTEVLGQDGIAMAPLPTEYINDWRKNIAGLDGDSDSINWHYKDTAGYIQALKAAGLGVNAAYLAPHGNIRMEAMGLENRVATDEELDAMKKILRRELDAGALGLSTGLIYIPCAFADKKELIELCKVTAEKDGVFVVHERSEANQIISSMEEVIDIGRQSGVKVHFSHFKICGKNNWDKINQVIELLEKAKKEGIKVSFDQYPYTAGSTMLSVILPPWVHDGGTQALLDRLKDTDIRKKITDEVFEENSTWDNFVEFAGLEGIYITSVKTDENKETIGKNLVELGKLKNKEPLEAVFDLLVQEENAVGMIDYYGSEEHVVRFLQRPEQNVCTDGLLGGKPHPRVYGSFPRILGKYVREEKIMSLEEAIYKMTGRPSEVFNLKERGKIKPGFYADLVIFDRETIQDTATYTEPVQFPIGIEYVFINGAIVIEQGRHTLKKAGDFIQ